eukprot:3938307-Rhodomonas_salina.1
MPGLELEWHVNVVDPPPLGSRYMPGEGRASRGPRETEEVGNEEGGCEELTEGAGHRSLGLRRSRRHVPGPRDSGSPDSPDAQGLEQGGELGSEDGGQ